jgi:hypothetical protein
LNRLRFRDNWTLWVGGILCLLAILYLLFFLLSPRFDALDADIVYPFTLIYYNSILILAGATLIGLFIVGVWGHPTFERKNVWYASIALIGSIFVCASSPLLVVIGLAGTFIVAVIAGFRQEPPQGTALLLIAMAALLLFAPVGNRLLISFHHHSSLTFADHIYNLALMTDKDLDGYDETYIVYQCDDQGLRCNHLDRFLGYSESLVGAYRDAPTQVSLVSDPAQGQVYIEIDGERFPVNP